jgi:hypothetical protein
LWEDLCLLKPSSGPSIKILKILCIFWDAHRSHRKFLSEDFLSSSM